MNVPKRPLINLRVSLGIENDRNDFAVYGNGKHICISIVFSRDDVNRRERYLNNQKLFSYTCFADIQN